MALKEEAALSVLARVEKFTDLAKAAAQAQGKDEFWHRDKTFISTVRDCLLSNDKERVHWAFDQTRNLSQGFGSYCGDLKQLDGLLDELHRELAHLVSADRTEG